MSIHSKDRESGVILVSVIIITIIMMIVTIGVISTSVSQSLYTQDQIERIKSEQLAKGAAWVNYINLSLLQNTAVIAPAVLDGKTYTTGITTTLGANIDTHDIQVSY